MYKKLLAIFLISLLYLSCASLSQLVQKPTVKFNKMELINFSFQDVTANFNLAVTNPNPFGISLAGYDYGFSIENQNFLNGDQTENIQLSGNQTNSIDIPVTIKFKELYNMFKALKNQDEAGYGLKGHVHVNSPLEVFKIPFSISGKLPAIKLPKVSLAGVKVQSLSFSGVKLDLNIEVDNPNIFGFSLNNFNYNIALAGKNLVNGRNPEGTAVPEKGKSSIRFPINLDFSAVGSLLTSALRTGKIDYVLTGDAGLKTKFGDTKLPINRSGDAKLWK